MAQEAIWGFEMATIDQKERYRQRAALCYNIAATLAGDTATSMKRLGDSYAGLAEPSPKSRTRLFVHCDRCNETMIWKER
jgi:hypothetical protein